MCTWWKVYKPEKRQFRNNKSKIKARSKKISQKKNKLPVRDLIF